MFSRLRQEAGMSLVELLIAMTVISVAIFALVAGLTSGIEATKRASKASTAGTLADARMESYRRGTYSAIASIAGASQVGPDGRTYFVTSTSALGCVFGALDTSVTPPVCPDGANALKNRPLTVVKVTVQETDVTGKVLIEQTSTFDQSTGS